MGEFIKHENEAVTYVAAFGDSVSLLLISLAALVVTGMMKYSSTVKNCYRHFLQWNHSKLMTNIRTDTDHNHLNVPLLFMVGRAFSVSPRCCS